MECTKSVRHPWFPGIGYNLMHTFLQSQMMAKEYKERGGGYMTDKKDEKAKHLDKW